jgi:Tol biopolymer transport system component
MSSFVVGVRLLEWGKSFMADLQTPTPAGERLDSWKEIAAYLKRDPRTIQRWEKKEGLPVHRHVHDSQVSVYAYKNELDAWLASRSLANGNGDTVEVSPAWYGRRGIWAATLLGILTIAAINGAIRLTRPARGPVRPAFRQILDAADVDFTIAVSPGGRYATFTDVRGLGVGDLGVWDLNAHQRRVLTHGSGWTFDAVFSPDEKSIVYSYIAGKTWELHTIGVDGNGDRILLKDSDGRNFDLLDWSPDGMHIAALIGTADQKIELALISPSDGSVRVLKRFGSVQITRAAFSSDSKYLAYDAPSGEPGSGNDIFLISTDGKDDRPLIQHPAEEFLVGWSPKGDSLVFGSTRTGTWGIWRAPYSNGKVQGEPQLLKEDVGRVLPVSVARSGAVFLLQYVGIADVYTAELGSTVPPARISENPIGLNGNPSYSSDGKSLMYQSSRGSNGRGVLRIRSLATGQERELRPKLDYYQGARWSSDSHWIEVRGTDSTTNGAWRVDPFTGDVTLMLAGKPLPVFRPPLPEGDPGPGSPTPSPDGSVIARAVRGYPKGYNSLLLVPPSGGPPHELVRLKQPEGFTAAFAWSPDGKYVYFTRHTNSDTELMRIPAVGGAIESLGLRMSMIRNLTIHPDGKHIAFAGGESNNLELWALEGFF